MGKCGCWSCSKGYVCPGVGAFTSVTRVAPAPQPVVFSRGKVVSAPSQQRAFAPSFDQQASTVAVHDGPTSQRMQVAKVSLGVADPFVKRAGTLQGAAGGLAGAAVGAAAGAAYGSVVPVLGSIIGGVVGAVVGGFFADDDAKKRRQANLAKYGAAWANAKYTLSDQITRSQRRVDTIDRDSIALDKTLNGNDQALSGVTPPESVTTLVATSKSRAKTALQLLANLRDSVDGLTALANVVASGEAQGSTGPGSEAQVALEQAVALTRGIDAQVSAVARAQNLAVQAARSATSAVNRWIDTENARAQAAAAAAWQAQLVESVTARLQATPY